MTRVLLAGNVCGIARRLHIGGIFAAYRSWLGLNTRAEAKREICCCYVCWRRACTASPAPDIGCAFSFTAQSLILTRMHSLL